MYIIQMSQIMAGEVDTQQVFIGSDEQLAKRFANALKRAATLCGGKVEPF